MTRKARLRRGEGSAMTRAGGSALAHGSAVADGLVRLFCRWGCQGVGMPRGSDFDKRGLADLLRKQHMVLAREQALGCGLTVKAVRHRLRPEGPWRRLLPGVYMAQTGIPSDDQRDMAALLYAGPRGVLTGAAALRRQVSPAAALAWTSWFPRTSTGSMPGSSGYTAPRGYRGDSVSRGRCGTRSRRGQWPMPRAGWRTWARCARWSRGRCSVVCARSSAWWRSWNRGPSRHRLCSGEPWPRSPTGFDPPPRASCTR